MGDTEHGYKSEQTPGSVEEQAIKPEMFPFDAFEFSKPSATNPYIRIKIDSDEVPQWSFFGLVPIGAVIAWHKSLTGVPALPEGWAECDGSTVSDSDSPLNGQALPDLNGDGRFLRGHTSTSGTEQADAFQSHYHAPPVGSTHIMGRDAVNPDNEYGTSDTNMDAFGDTGSPSEDTSDSYGAPKVAAETRPVNMSVIWVMRIK